MLLIFNSIILTQVLHSNVASFCFRLKKAGEKYGIDLSGGVYSKADASQEPEAPEKTKQPAKQKKIAAAAKPKVLQKVAVVKPKATQKVAVKENKIKKNTTALTLKRKK